MKFGKKIKDKDITKDNDQDKNSKIPNKEFDITDESLNALFENKNTIKNKFKNTFN